MSRRGTPLSSPPRARIAFRVGIVGHRPNRLPKDEPALAALRRMLGTVLACVKEEVEAFAGSPEGERLYAGQTPLLRATSPLAEGSDRIFAEEAITLGYDLLCPMPFHQEEFEKDFRPPHCLEADSLGRFRGLLEQAAGGAGLTKYELDGSRAAAHTAYGEAGRVVLNQSDLLVAVWDGKKAAGGGGTVDTLCEAIRYHVPVLWIDPHAPHCWQLVRRPGDLPDLDGNKPCRQQVQQPGDPEQARLAIAAAIKSVVAEELGLPAPPPRNGRAPATKSHATDYFRERKPRFNLAVVWKLFRDVVSTGTLRFQSILVRDFEQQIKSAWPTCDDVNAGAEAQSRSARQGQDAGQPSPVEDWVNRRLRVHYAWADKRGDMYADAYRTAYLLTYLLSALAVFIALLPMAAGWERTGERVCVAAELAVLMVIVFLLIAARARHWHERWMEYRLLAELIRQIRFLIPLGGGRPFPRAPIHHGVYENLNQTWMYWHMRGVARATSIPPARVTPEYVRDCLRCVGDVVCGRNGQLEFHRTREIQSNRIGHRLHVASTALFVLTIVSIAVHLAIGLSGTPGTSSWPLFGAIAAHDDAIGRWLVLAAATLPALGAALSGVANQGEFARLAKRSAAMGDAFEQFARQIQALQSDTGGRPPTLAQLVPLASNIAEVMVDEVADWRVVVIEQPPRPA